MLGLCTKHCTWIVIIAIVLTIALQRVPAPLHIPVGGWGCAMAWSGVPFGFFSRSAPACLDGTERFLNYFVNGLLNTLLFFFVLRIGHDRLLHRREWGVGSKVSGSARGGDPPVP